MGSPVRPYPIEHAFADGTPISFHPVQADRHFDVHTHPFHEIAYIAEGIGTLAAGRDAIPVAKGDLIFIPKDREHVFQPQKHSTLEVLNCLFKEEVLDPPQGLSGYLIFDDMAEITGMFRDCTDCIKVREQAGEFARLMYALKLELSWKQTGFRYKLYIYLMNMLTRIRQIAPLSAAPPRPAADPVQFAVDYIHKAYRNPMPLEEFCRSLGISSRQFQRRFKAETGRTYTQMLQDVRVRVSCDLLLDTDWSIQTVAQEVGLQDMKHFYRLFRERCAMTPHELRLQIGGESRPSPERRNHS
ncbi:AraC family transcriptional regulator [Paenibacillus mucilaginosus]|uniref:Transcriptional regulator, AraC family n=1 Tax=Paenibacillus mucilaginosus (strain KNP414) TaxID=1036673 RepID=F8FJT3_PAEMK|nr:AraC family transcriptional regulator [Paenibacillus mucilaginosus]AEI43414.1 transcriptional regulator, AraC family [Paenibacillus mucilaginosus KNP414]MCG7212039.1 AraC family transcriptional regulator [Paenibacillus mucilaginosus]WDM24975.1 helix-turn-helix transcriptional regulator [Paenibacillus mucilaginosus]